MDCRPRSQVRNHCNSNCWRKLNDQSEIFEIRLTFILFTLNLKRHSLWWFRFCILHMQSFLIVTVYTNLNEFKRRRKLTQSTFVRYAHTSIHSLVFWIKKFNFLYLFSLSLSMKTNNNNNSNNNNKRASFQPFLLLFLLSTLFNLF